MIKQISDKDAEVLLRDHAKYKLFVAESILGEIKSPIPSRPNYDTLILETYVESFLFFIVSVQDILLREINRKYRLVDKKVNPYSILKKLNVNDQKQDNIKKILEKYFSIPYRTTKQLDKKSYEDILLQGFITETTYMYDKDDNYYQTYWYRENTRLWELRQLRNQVSHERIMSTNTYVGSKNDVVFVLKLVDEVKDTLDFIEIAQPYDYLTSSLDQTKQFLYEIRQIIN
ncbi:MAG: hypothetical protein ACREAD_08320 [Nitrosopumilaceae archaeon]